MASEDTNTATAAGTKPEMQEIASIARDIQRVFYGRVLTNQDEVLATRGGAKGLKIYDELKRDAHCGAVLAKRKLAVTGREWDVKPATKSAVDQAAADMVKAAYEHLRFNQCCKRLLEATLKGFSVSEVMWEVRDGKVLPAKLIARAPQRFVFDLDGNLRLRVPENTLEGIELPPRKFIVHRRGADDDNPYGHGIGGMLFWPVFFKRNTITFWLTFADKFGSPTSVGKYPNGAGLDEQDKLKAALAALSNDSGVIVPEGMVIELLEAARSGSADTYEKLVRYMDEQISKAVLGETMSTTAAATGLGSNQADVQDGVRLEVAKDDGAELDETLNDTLTRWIVELNMPGAGMPKVQRNFDEPEDLSDRADRDKKLNEMGWEPTDAYMLETYGEGWQKKVAAPMPGSAEGLQGPEGAQNAPGNTNAPATAKNEPGATNGPQFAEGAALQHAVKGNMQAQLAMSAGAENAAASWEALVGTQVQNLRSMLDETGDLVLFKERLSELLDKAPPKATVEALQRATFTARLMGQTQAIQSPAQARLNLAQKLRKALSRSKT